jgi:hypothetical protein
MIASKSSRLCINNQSAFRGCSIESFWYIDFVYIKSKLCGGNYWGK